MKITRVSTIELGDAPGHGMTLNEDVVRASLNPGSIQLPARQEALS